MANCNLDSSFQHYIRNPFNASNNLSDPSLEIEDPCPNVHEMFVDFDQRFFKGTLVRNGVVVSWSPKMTLCAGLCRYNPRNRECDIKLSKPLLSLRTRKDLVETLIHEMIHALLFVENVSDNRESHGPIFHQNMYKINKEANLNISVYHSFHDEVNHFKTHVWKCNGICQNRPPYYGLVRRSMNRKPGKSDSWWASHKAMCDGEFIKISEPEDTKNKKLKNKIENKIKDIRQFFSPPKSNGDNINGIDNLNNENNLNLQKNKIEPFKGVGKVLGNNIKNPLPGKSILLTKFGNISNNSVNPSTSTNTFNLFNKSVISSINKSITPTKSNTLLTNQPKTSVDNKSTTLSTNTSTINKSNTPATNSNKIRNIDNKKELNSINVLDENCFKRPNNKLNDFEVINIENNSPLKKQKLNIDTIVLDDDDYCWLNDLSDADLLKVSQDHPIVINDDDDDYNWLNNLSDADLLKVSQDHSIIIDDDDKEFDFLCNVSDEILLKTSDSSSNSIMID